MYIAKWSPTKKANFNKGFEKIFNLNRENVIGKRASEVIHQNNLISDWIELLGQAALTDKHVSFKHYLPSSKKWYNCSVYSPKKGYVICVVEVDHLQIEQALKQARARFKAVQQVTGVGTWELDVKTNKLFWSEELLKIWGLPIKKLSSDLNAEYRKRVLPEDLEHVDSTMQEFLTTGKRNETIGFNYRIKLPNTTIRTLHSERKIITVDEQGKPSRIFGVEQDVSEQKIIHHQLEECNRQVEELVEERVKQLKESDWLAAVRQTAGIVGHDIRNPLQSIISEIYLAGLEVKSLPEGQTKASLTESLEQIQQNSEYINKIVSDLQDYAKPLKMEVEEIDLRDIIKKTLLNNVVPDDIFVVVSVEETIKKTTVEPNFIKRILGNLVLNAVQAMPKGGTLTIRAFQEANNIVLTVEDTGEGIPEKIQGYLFKPLFTTKSKGQGFGLAVCKRLVEALGGKITFKTQTGKGTKFIVQLPNKPLNS